MESACGSISPHQALTGNDRIAPLAEDVKARLWRVLEGVERSAH